MQSYLKKIIRIQQNKQIKLDFRNIVLMSLSNKKIVKKR